MNNPRTVPYFVSRKVTPTGSEYHVHSPGKPCAIIRRKGKHFLTLGNYHRTLRDAIIYVVYGV